MAPRFSEKPRNAVILYCRNLQRLSGACNNMAKRSSSRTKPTPPRDPLKAAIDAVSRRHGRFGGGRAKDLSTPAIAPAALASSPSSPAAPKVVPVPVPAMPSVRPICELVSRSTGESPTPSRWERFCAMKAAGDGWCSRNGTMIIRLLGWLAWLVLALLILDFVKIMSDWALARMMNLVR